jgi:hypothetical protein
VFEDLLEPSDPALVGVEVVSGELLHHRRVLRRLRAPQRQPRLRHICIQ